MDPNYLPQPLAAVDKAGPLWLLLESLLESLPVRPWVFALAFLALAALVLLIFMTRRKS